MPVYYGVYYIKNRPKSHVSVTLKQHLLMCFSLVISCENV